jgi:hypothetical protein
MSGSSASVDVTAVDVTAADVIASSGTMARRY